MQHISVRPYPITPSTGQHTNNVTWLVGSDLKHMRIVDFRAIFEESATELFVTKVGPRTGICGDWGMMMTNQTLVFPSGDELVVRTHSDYKDLVDVRDHAQAMH
jgi:hypothetical protein